MLVWTARGNETTIAIASRSCDEMPANIKGASRARDANVVVKVQAKKG